MKMQGRLQPQQIFKQLIQNLQEVGTIGMLNLTMTP